MLLKWNVEYTSSSLLLLKLTNSLLFLNFLAKVNTYGWSFDLVSFLWLGNVHTVDVVLLCLDDSSFWLGKLNVEYHLASKFFSLIEIIILQCADFNPFQVVFCQPLLDNLFFILGQILNSSQISFIESNNNRLVLKQWLDSVVQMNLFQN